MRSLLRLRNNNCNDPFIFSNINFVKCRHIILSQVHVVGRGSREGSLKPADALAPSGPLPIFKQILQDECCRIGDTIVLSCRGKLINNHSICFINNYILYQ